jgi:uracil-DNA glycosylase family 4
MTDTFFSQLAQCRLCPLPHEPYPLLWGNLNAPIALLGQAPSRKGHITGKPWNDASGHLLRQWLGVTDSQFYEQGYFYLTALAHCFPGKALSGGGDKKPPKLCWDTWVQQEVAMATPQLWITVGRLACQKLLPTARDFTQAVFSNPHRFNDRPLWCLPHPSPANRCWLKQYPQFVTEQVPRLQQSIKAL